MANAAAAIGASFSCADTTTDQCVVRKTGEPGLAVEGVKGSDAFA